MIKLKLRNNFKRLHAYLDRANAFDPENILHEYGRLGVAQLAAATPVDTGAAASSWSYKIEGNKTRYKLIFTNSDIAGNVPTVILLQYGHATKSGYYLSGIDIINPALRPLYRSLARRIGQEVR